MLHTSGYFAGFIDGSSPAATLEGARRCAHTCFKTALYRRVYLAGNTYPWRWASRSLEGILVAVLRYS
jgi:hypothetical protein